MGYKIAFVLIFFSPREDKATLQSDLSAQERRGQGKELSRYCLPFSALCFSSLAMAQKR